jgi:hypothetical protein
MSSRFDYGYTATGQRVSCFRRWWIETTMIALPHDPTPYIAYYEHRAEQYRHGNTYAVEDWIGIVSGSDEETHRERMAIWQDGQTKPAPFKASLEASSLRLHHFSPVDPSGAWWNCWRPGGACRERAQSYQHAYLRQALPVLIWIVVLLVAAFLGVRMTEWLT